MFIITVSSGQKSKYSTAQLNLLLLISQGSNQGVWQAVPLSGGSGERPFPSSAGSSSLLLEDPGPCFLADLCHQGCPGASLWSLQVAHLSQTQQWSVKSFCLESLIASCALSCKQAQLSEAHAMAGSPWIVSSASVHSTSLRFRIFGDKIVSALNMSRFLFL